MFSVVVPAPVDWRSAIVFAETVLAMLTASIVFVAAVRTMLPASVTP